MRASREQLQDQDQATWAAAIDGLVALGIDRVADRLSVFCRPDPSPTQSGVINTFSKFALPMTWDFIEGVPIAGASGSFLRQIEWIALAVEHCLDAISSAPSHKVNAYIDERGLRRSDTFRHVLQALIELADEGSDERSVLERISNHLQAKGQAPATLLDRLHA